MKKSIVIISFVCIILIILAFLIFNNKDLDDNELVYTIINLNENHATKSDVYYLYSDENYKYFIKENPKKMYVLLSSIGEIDNKIYKIAKKKLADGNYRFSIDNNYLRMNQLVKSLHLEEIKIDELKSSIDIISEENNYHYQIDEYNYKKDDAIKLNLYYTDQYNIKIYLDGISYFKIKYNNDYIELSEFLKNSNCLSDSIFYSINTGSKTNDFMYLSEVYDSNNILSIIYGNIKIAKQFKNNEIYYIISSYYDN